MRRGGRRQPGVQLERDEAVRDADLVQLRQYAGVERGEGGARGGNGNRRRKGGAQRDQCDGDPNPLPLIANIAGKDRLRMSR